MQALPKQDRPNSISFTSLNSNAVPPNSVHRILLQATMQEEDPSRWTRKIAACAIGGVAAAFSGPVTAAYAGGMLVATVGASVVASTVSVVADNAMKPTRQEIRYRPYQAQRVFRNMVTQFLDTHFNSIIETIRRNRPGRFGPLTFSVTANQLQGLLGFAYEEGSSVVIQYEFYVRPRPGTDEREIGNSREPPLLPNYANPDDTVVYSLPDDLRNTTNTIYDGLKGSILRGAVIGLLGGLFLPVAPAWYFFETAPGVAGIVLGGPSFAGGAASAAELASTNPTPFEKIAYSVNFASEIRLNVNRIIQCANDNGVELQYQIKAGVGHRASAVTEGNSALGAECVQIWYEDQGYLL
jgi:hypothetical protein